MKEEPKKVDKKFELNLDLLSEASKSKYLTYFGLMSSLDKSKTERDQKIKEHFNNDFKVNT